MGSSTLSGHYIAYVLTDPAAVLGGKPKENQVNNTADSEHLEPSLVAGPAAVTEEQTSHGREKVDHRVWCYCSE